MVKILCRIFDGQIGQKNSIGKLVEKLGEKCLWKNSEEQLIGKNGLKLGRKNWLEIYAQKKLWKRCVQKYCEKLCGKKF